MECPIPLNIHNSLSVTAFKSSIKTHYLAKFAMSEKFMKALLNCTMNILRMYCVIVLCMYCKILCCIVLGIQ